MRSDSDLVLADSEEPLPATRSAPIGEKAPAMIDLGNRPSSEEALALVSEAYASGHGVLPLELIDDRLVVACAQPGDLLMLSELQVLCRREVIVLGASALQIGDAIHQRYKVLVGVDQQVEAFTARHTREAPALDSALRAVNERSPVVQVVNMIISQGVRDRASDIHIEPQEDRLRIRFRIDGLLTDAISLPRTMASAMCSRIKVMANMDIVDRHRAQDGQMRIEDSGRQVDVRVSTAETIWGEKVVLRLLDQGRVVLSLDQLGLESRGYGKLSTLLRSPYGMIVVSGPTGSGKTTSLYAAIKELDPVTQNIMTIEDPVEYTFGNINQIQIRKMANLTFANGLKAILRQDPDVIMVGEIRDLETAEIAVQSALTGHLVLSSLHATDASGVIERFIEMGIQGFLVASALVGVVAQRLVRRICPFCIDQYELSAEEAELWSEHRPGSGKGTFMHGHGCTQCAGTGFRGRVGVFEVLAVTDSLKRLISGRAPAHEIRAQAVKEGMLQLREDAVTKVEANLTTLGEVIRCVWLN